MFHISSAICSINDSDACISSKSIYKFHETCQFTSTHVCVRVINDQFLNFSLIIMFISGYIKDLINNIKLRVLRSILTLHQSCRINRNIFVTQPISCMGSII